MSNREIVSLNASILDELHIEELEDKFEMTLLPALDLIVEKVELVGPGMVQECTVQCSGNCTSQCGSQCYSNTSRFLGDHEVNPSPVMSKAEAPPSRPLP